MASYNAEDMLVSLQSSLPALYRMATGGGYVIGISLAVKSVYNLKVYGEARTMMASHTSAKEPIFNLIIAGMLIYFPTGFAVMMQTTFGYSNVLAYQQFPTASGVALSVPAIVLLQIVQLIGVYAFVKGWLMLSRSASQNAQQGMFGKGLMHLMGGVFAMNVVGTFNVIAGTFGITF